MFVDVDFILDAIYWWAPEVAGMEDLEQAIVKVATPESVDWWVEQIVLSAAKAEETEADKLPLPSLADFPSDRSRSRHPIDDLAARVGAIAATAVQLYLEDGSKTSSFDVVCAAAAAAQAVVRRFQESSGYHDDDLADRLTLEAREAAARITLSLVRYMAEHAAQENFEVEFVNLTPEAADVGVAMMLTRNDADILANTGIGDLAPSYGLPIALVARLLGFFGSLSCYSAGVVELCDNSDYEDVRVDLAQAAHFMTEGDNRWMFVPSLMVEGLVDYLGNIAEGVEKLTITSSDESVHDMLLDLHDEFVGHAVDAMYELDTLKEPIYGHEFELFFGDDAGFPPNGSDSP